MGRFTADEIQIAKAVDLVDLAEAVGFPVKKKGGYYQLQDISSAMIFNRTSWYRYSQSVGGSTIDFLMYFKDMDYQEAVGFLLDYAGYRKWEQKTDTKIREASGKKQKLPEKEKKPFLLPEKAGDSRRLYAYLMKKRRLSKQVIQAWIDKGLLYESRKYHNLVFLGRDPEGNVRFASQRGTMDGYGKAFKGDVEGNDKTYGINLVSRENPSLFVYEAAIDAMSDMDFHKDYRKNFLALGMVSDGPLMKLLEHYRHIRTLHLCLDNDGPGRKAAKKLGRKYVLEGYAVFVHLPPFGKDYNEFLQCERENRALYEQLNRQREKKQEERSFSSEGTGEKKPQMGICRNGRVMRQAVR